MKWIETSIYEYCPFSYGKGLKKETRKNGRTPVFGSSGCVGYNDRPYIDQAGIIIGRKGTVGKVQLSLEAFWPIDTTFYISGFSEKELYFIYYLLKVLQLEKMNSDSAIPGLSREAVHAISVIIPEKKEDREKIGDLLYKFDNKIELNNQINQTLEQMPQGLFKSWFVDFEPVLAEAEAVEAGNDPELAAMQVISGKSIEELERFAQSDPEAYQELAHTASLFPSEFVESELGMIPMGWEVKPLSKYSGFKSGYAFKSSQWKDYGIPVIKIGCLQSRIVNLQKASFISLDDMGKISSDFKVNMGDCLVSMTGEYIGAVSLVATKGDVFINQRVGVFKPFSEEYNSYLYSVVFLKEFKEYIISKSYGSAQANISSSAILDYICVWADNTLIKKYNLLVADFIERIVQNYNESETLVLFRDTLLPKLLSGEIEISGDEG